MHDTMIPERLKELRANLGMTQRAFASSLDVTPPTYSAYETGANMPPVNFLMKIHDKYKVSLDWLCGYSDRKHGSITGTYADAIRTMLDLIEKGIIIVSEEGDIYGNYSHELDFAEKRVKGFFSEWIRMSQLTEQKTIDEELYNLWLEKQLKQYEVKIEPVPDTPQKSAITQVAADELPF